MAREHREAKARSPSPHISRRRRPDLGSAHPLAAGAAETASVLLVKAPSVPVKKQEALSTISSSMTNEAHPNPIGEQPAPFVGPFIIDPRSSRSPVSSKPLRRPPPPDPVQGRSWGFHWSPATDQPAASVPWRWPHELMVCTRRDVVKIHPLLQHGFF